MLAIEWSAVASGVKTLARIYLLIIAQFDLFQGERTRIRITAMGLCDDQANSIGF